MEQALGKEVCLSASFSTMKNLFATAELILLLI